MTTFDRNEMLNNVRRLTGLPPLSNAERLAANDARATELSDRLLCQLSATAKKEQAVVDQAERERKAATQTVLTGLESDGLTADEQVIADAIKSQVTAENVPGSVRRQLEVIHGVLFRAIRAAVVDTIYRDGKSPTARSRWATVVRNVLEAWAKERGQAAEGVDLEAEVEAVLDDLGQLLTTEEEEIPIDATGGTVTVTASRGIQTTRQVIDGLDDLGVDAVNSCCRSGGPFELIEIIR